MSSERRSARGRARASNDRASREPAWAALDDEALPRLPLGDLGLTIQGSLLAPRVARLHAELEAAGVPLRPRVWLSSDWFAPDGLPGFAIPFFLAHPRLVQLERARCGAVEGEGEEECMRLLRHETGHALGSAFRLHRRKAWRRRFGLYSTPYRSAYRPDPTSRAHVRNLDGWYAQSHPAEDFCETFAVWLRPRAGWRRRYGGWAALEKLRFVDEEMQRIRGLEPLEDPGEETEVLGELAMTLGTYYRRKRRRHASREPAEEDAGLVRAFGDPVPEPVPEPGRGLAEGADVFLRRHRGSLLRAVARRTGLELYAIDQLLKRLAGRAFALGSIARPQGHDLLARTTDLLAEEARALQAGRALEFYR